MAVWGWGHSTPAFPLHMYTYSRLLKENSCRSSLCCNSTDQIAEYIFGSPTHTLIWCCASYASHGRSLFCTFVLFILQGSTLQTTLRRPSATLSSTPLLTFSSTCGRLTLRTTRPRRYGKDPKPHLVHAGSGGIGRCRGHVDRTPRTYMASLRRNFTVLNEETLPPASMHSVDRTVARGVEVPALFSNIPG